MRLLLAAFCGIFCLLLQGTDAQTCTGIQNCKNCTDESEICYGCLPNTVITKDLSKCLSCPLNCEVCNITDGEKTKCTVCKEKFYEEDGKCERCPGNCKTCSDGETCTTCSDRFYDSSGSGVTECTACPGNCKTCKISGVCLVCDKGYYLSSGSCIVCQGGCKECTSATSCQVCDSNKFWKTDTCTDCSSNCMTGMCNHDNGCTKCNAGYYVKDKGCDTVANCKEYTDGTGCKTCDPGYILTSATQCDACKTLDQTECETCKTTSLGSFWSFTANKCEYCGANCLICQDATTCLKCATGFIVDSNNDCQACSAATTVPDAQCGQCPGFFSSSSTCSACGTIAASDTADKCNNCPASTGVGRFFSSDSCVVCPTASSDVTALAPQAACDSCNRAKNGIYWDPAAGPAACAQVDCATAGNLDSSLKCEACKDKIFVQCESCGTGCDVCSSATTCTKCSDGYTLLTDGTCSNTFTCSGAFDTKDECVLCTGSYWDSTATTCTAVDCAGTLDTEVKCKACVGRFWDTSGTPTCGTVTCTTGTISSLNTADKCNACRKLGFYHDGTNCAEITVSTHCVMAGTAAQCAACDGFEHDGTNCVAVTAGALTAENTCTQLFGRQWKTACEGFKVTGAMATAGNKAGSEPFIIPDLATYYDGSDNWTPCPTTETAMISYGSTKALCDACSNAQWNGFTCLLKTGTCSNFATQWECINCKGQYFDSSATPKCQPLLCDDVSTLTTQTKCHGCPAAAWKGGNCVAVTDCRADITDEDDCNGCRHYGRYWDSSACQRVSKCSTSSPEKECNACDGYAWNSGASTPACEAVSAAADITANTITAKECDHLFARFYDSACEVFSALPGADTTDLTSSKAYYTFVPVYIKSVSSTDTFFARTTNTDFITNTEECTAAPGKFWQGTAASSHCKDYTEANCDDREFRDKTASHCNLCGKYNYGPDHGTGTPFNEYLQRCHKVDCTSLAHLTTQARCLACGKGYHWDSTNTVCLKADCTNDPLTEVDSCTSCSTLDAGLYLKSEAICKDCPANCATCGDTGCLTCKAGFHLKDKVCTACSTAPTTKAGCSQCPDVFWTNPASNTDGACSSCGANCNKCNNAQDCTTCKPGYIPVNGVCALCNLGTNECKQCGTTDTGKYFDSTNNQCKDCPKGCPDCTDATTCGDKCAAKYYKSGTSCLPCPGDIQNIGTQASCEACFASTTSGVFYGETNTPKCGTCILNCESCTSATTCDKCIGARYFDTTTTKCEDCVTGCAECDSGTDCKKCDANKYFNGMICTDCDTNCVKCDTKTGCSACATGFYLDKTTKTCIACNTKDSNCVECDENQCTTCASKMYLDSKKKCLSCLDGCAECTSAANCRQCEAGKCFLQNDKETKCVDTTLNCNKCARRDPVAPATTGEITCIDCRGGFYKGVCKGCGDHCITCDKDKCTKCVDQGVTSALGTDGKCQKCHSQCSACAPQASGTDGTCNTCKERTYKDGNDCKGCPTNCKVCAKGTDDKVTCSTCNDGSYKDGDGACLTCPTGCTTCTSKDACTACSAEYRLFNSTKCEACVTNCVECNAADQCTKCKDTFYKATTDGKDTCTTCGITNCAKCVKDGDATKCTKCADTYSLQAGKCEKCKIQSCGKCITSKVCGECEADFSLNKWKIKCNPICYQCEGDSCPDARKDDTDKFTISECPDSDDATDDSTNACFVEGEKDSKKYTCKAKGTVECVDGKTSESDKCPPGNTCCCVGGKCNDGFKPAPQNAAAELRVLPAVLLTTILFALKMVFAQ